MTKQTKKITQPRKNSGFSSSKKTTVKKNKRKTKYIFVVGGVMSGVGKGVTASSLSKILQFRGLSVSAIKIDPYVNVDAGTMNPTEHGEVFVLNDGFETDQDMGNYERFLGTSLSRDSYMTTGSVYLSVINKERALKYKGKCVDVVPHVPLEVIAQIKRAAKKESADIMIIEIGGTLGEYQNILFLEAARMLQVSHPKDVALLMVSYLPTPSKIGEMKTKPTQYAVRTMSQSGLRPDIIVGRSDRPMDEKRKEKIAFSCSLQPEDIISAPDLDSIYDIPSVFLEQNLDKRILDKLNIPLRSTRRNNKVIIEWNNFVASSKNTKKEVQIAVVGKYFDSGDFVLSDAYISIIEALKYSSYKEGVKPKLTWINSKDFETGKRKVSELKKYQGVLVPGGFGSTGIEGKIKVIKYVRENKIPYLGICYGMQLAAVEFARHVAKIKGATTYEIDPNAKKQVVTILSEQKEKLQSGDYGGSMRLGAYDAILTKGSLAASLYGSREITERHRHRYELNPEYVDELEHAGLVVSGTSPDGKLPEIIELPKKTHPFFLAVQFHPEFLARPLDPHPLFTGFVKAAKKIKL